MVTECFYLNGKTRAGIHLPYRYKVGWGFDFEKKVVIRISVISILWNFEC